MQAEDRNYTRTLPDHWFASRENEGSAEYSVPPYSNDEDKLFLVSDATMALTTENMQRILRTLKEEFVCAGKLSRFTYCDMAESQYLLVILDHNIFDHYGIQILTADIALLIGGMLNGKNVDLPPKSISYRAWGLKIQEYFEIDPGTRRLVVLALPRMASYQKSAD